MGNRRVPLGKWKGLSWAQLFTEKVVANGAAHGVPDSLRDSLAANLAEWESEFEAYESAHRAALAARANRDLARQKAEQDIDRIALILRANDAPLIPFMLEEHDQTKTRIRPPKVAPRIDAASVRERVVELRFRGAGKLRRKPDGAKSCEIWVKLGGDPPESLADCRYLAIATRSPFRAEFAAEEIGEPAHFIARWLSPRGEPGPASEAVSATIPL